MNALGTKKELIHDRFTRSAFSGALLGMSFTFVHTADWQIGKAFGRFATDVAVRLRAARLDAIDRIAGVAREAGAKHVLVAGDVFDSEIVDDTRLLQPMSRMSAYPELYWHLLPGNHDPARPGGVWARLSRLGLPVNVKAHLEPAPQLLEPGVVLLPAPLRAKEMRTDPTQWMDSAETADGSIRIGLAHGSAKGFGSLGEAAVPIEPSRASSARLDYLALGDWHGLKEVARSVWYSGTPEPDSYAGNGQGQTLVVRVAGGGAPPEVKPVPSGSFQWLARRLVVARLADLDPIAAELDAAGAERRHMLLELRLEGAIGAAEAVALEARLGLLASALTAIDVDRRRLRVTVSDDDVGLFGDPVLGAVLERLRQHARNGDEAEARIAGRATRLLLALTTANGEGTGPS